MKLPQSLKFDKKEIETLKKIIKDIREAVVLTHIGPDQDALMSLISLAHILQINTTAIIRPIYEDDFLQELKDLPSLRVVERVDNIYDTLEKYQPSHVFMVDINHIRRLTRSKKEELKDYLENKTKTIIIDHHLTPGDFKPYFSIIKQYPSSAELLYYLASSLELSLSGTEKELLIGMLGDTGLLKYSKTKEHPAYLTTQAITNLDMQKPDMDFREIIARSQPNLTNDILPYVKDFINNLNTEQDYAYTFLDIDIQTLPKQTLAKIRRAKEYVLIFILNQMQKDINFIAMPTKNSIKFSIRSKPPFIVRTIAEKFGGGGHDNASGFEIKDTNLKQAIDIVKHEVEKLLNT